MNNNKGFTLLELIVTMALVIAVVIITGTAFEKIIKNTSQIVSSEESNIEGVVGLEMLRHDLQQIGFGLPNAYDVAPRYAETASAPASLLNDGHGTSAAGGVPRAVVSLENVTDTAYTTGNTYNIISGTDYLAIKASTVGRSQASKKWTFMTYTSVTTNKVPNQWSSQADNFSASNSAIVVNRTYAADTGLVTNNLVYNTSTPLTYWTTNPTVPLTDDSFYPAAASQMYYLYGIDDGNLRMPFNRADYFVARPSSTSAIPATCALGTGILYKAVVNHADGTMTYFPLLDCVADMQLVFGWDVKNSGVIDESNAYNTDVSKISVTSTIGTTAAQIKTIMEDSESIRTKLKYVKLYIMVQEGRKKPDYTNTNNLINNTLAVVVGDVGPNPPSNAALTRGYSAANLTTLGWLNYRWKIYRIVVRPKNLSSK